MQKVKVIEMQKHSDLYWLTLKRSDFGSLKDS
jgi:hypothetical protein